jgi:hypothetical protein
LTTTEREWSSNKGTRREGQVTIKRFVKQIVSNGVFRDINLVLPKTITNKQKINVAINRSKMKEMMGLYGL